MGFQGDRIIQVNLACVEELRCDIQAIREKIAEQVSETERSLHKFIQFELLKAQGYLKNVSEKLAAHNEPESRINGEDRHKFKDVPSRREGSPTLSSSAGNSYRQSEGDEAKSPLIDSNKNTKSQPPKQKLAEENGCPTTWRKRSPCDEGRGKGCNRSSVAASKVPGTSLLPKCSENGRSPKGLGNGKKSQWHRSLHANQEGKQAAVKPGDVDKMSSSKKQDWNRTLPNHMEPKSRETNPKRHSLSSECRDKVQSVKFSTVRLPLTIRSSNNMNHSTLKTRFLRRHQDEEVRALFGL